MHIHHKCRFPFGNVISVPWVQWWKAGLAVLLNLQLDPGIPNSFSSLLSSPQPALTGSQWPPFLLTIPASWRMRPLALTPDFMLSPTSAHQIKLTTSLWALLWVRLLFLTTLFLAFVLIPGKTFFLHQHSLSVSFASSSFVTNPPCNWKLPTKAEPSTHTLLFIFRGSAIPLAFFSLAALGLRCCKQAFLEMRCVRDTPQLWCSGSVVVV